MISKLIEKDEKLVFARWFSYHADMIKSFKTEETETIWNEIVSPKFPYDIQRRALQKLRMLNAALVIDDLRIPYSNHFEALSGKRKGQYSIRINNQYRICFRWFNGDSFDVEITDYH